LKVAAPDHLPIILVSAVLSVGIGFSLGVRGMALVLTIAVLTVGVLAIGELARGILANPKLERYKPKLGPVPLSKNIRPAH
jgi:hypothetical protein